MVNCPITYCAVVYIIDKLSEHKTPEIGFQATDSYSDKKLHYNYQGMLAVGKSSIKSQAPN